MINKELNAAEAEIFSDLYPELTQHIVENGKLVQSRNGSTLELLNFKTIISDPEKNLVGGYNRNMNIFFLFAEAVWIWLGKRDVKFLEFFNSQMKEYSDDGENFHAPYGWRLRNYGTPSTYEKFQEFLKTKNVGKDQIREVITMLTDNPQDRRVVMSIWNPDLDLNVKSKDLPCNDMVMLKIREDKLHLTIANRSNDLHWGLPTNVFQFSFIGFILSEILGVKRGTQVHNSQSLHVYLNNPLTLQILNLRNEKLNSFNQKSFHFYGVNIKQEIEFSDSKSNLEKLDEIDDLLSKIYDFISKIINSKDSNFSLMDCEELGLLKKKSNYLYLMFMGLIIYIQYVFEGRSKEAKLNAISKIEITFSKERQTVECRLMENFFRIRLDNNTNHL